MDRAKFAHSRMLVTYEDGTSLGTCSIHCLAIDLAINIDKTPRSFEVGDFNSNNLIDAEKAFWVVGGNKPGVMSKQAKWAFEKKENADKFIAENGGTLATFDEAMKATYQSMYDDTKMIREKRKIKKNERGRPSIGVSSTKSIKVGVKCRDDGVQWLCRHAAYRPIANSKSLVAATGEFTSQAAAFRRNKDQIRRNEMKKMLMYSAILLSCCAAGFAVAADKGPAEITLQATIDPAATPKPATFPHAAHQARMECGTCHHGKDAAGKRVAYTEGQKIEKCETCHNSKVEMPEKVKTYKNAAHALCQDCHKKEKPELAKCTVCHKK